MGFFEVITGISLNMDAGLSSQWILLSQYANVLNSCPSSGWPKGPFKYYLSMFLTFLTPPNHLISRHQHFFIPISNLTSAFPHTHPPMYRVVRVVHQCQIVRKPPRRFPVGFWQVSGRFLVIQIGRWGFLQVSEVSRQSVIDGPHGICLIYFFSLISKWGQI